MIDEWGKGAKYWDHAWNPVIGCRKVSEGCANCYAATMADRFPELRDEKGGFEPHEPKKLKVPKQSGVLFCGNMTDLFGNWNSDPKLISLTAMIKVNKNPVKLILTKRPGRAASMNYLFFDDTMWYGTTGENQIRLEQRLAALIKIPCSQKWLSLEPLLGPIDLIGAVMNTCGSLDFFDPEALKKFFGWVVVGAESGPNRRPCDLEWVRLIVEQCRENHVPVFVKQLDIGGKLVKDIEKFPEDLQIRQVPWKQV